jgi:hypothetical protein
MIHAPLHRRLTPAQYAALQDEARACATRLRNEAIGDAWERLLRMTRRTGAALVAACRRLQVVVRTGAPAR